MTRQEVIGVILKGKDMHLTSLVEGLKFPPTTQMKINAA